ncbi:hypothetical protein Hrd1104_05715 [Halorhabdus sp. CBA1104]|uniref:DUF7490 domain-containing protein n=1 Tax=Halorhabdus sp. CBA1104 TaxID=1380432 RepID=UPI0012B2C604|nr:hypothetical protein [Halorhabdus sp. CBA1104]QGN06839.1 hypothetical protein Hrd1104_05715 [Halorhabdus sp. CBA1104]
MRREGYLAAATALLCVLAVATFLLVPGAVATHDIDAPSHLDIDEVTVAPGAVTGNAVTVQFGVALDHRGGPADNVSLTIRAVDAESGLVAAETSTQVGEIAGDREHRSRTNLTVAREGGYDLVAILYSDGERIDVERGSIHGVAGLSPTTIEFKRFETAIPTIDYTIEAAGDEQATLAVRTHLWNAGVDPAEGATLELVARQSDSNVVADRTTIDVDRLDSGQAVAPDAQLTVPSGYGYHLDAILKHDGVIVSSASSIADLDPDREIEADTTFESVPFEAEDFTEAEDVGETDGPTRPTATSGPGLGVISALLALAGIGLVSRLGGRQ